MHALSWLAKHRFQSLIRREADWVFAFEKDSCLRVECLWRMLKDDRVCVTSEDDGQKFGLPTPIDACARVNRCVGEQLATLIALSEGTLDINIHFYNGYVLQIIPTSAGYEAWEIRCGDFLAVAVGGGPLSIFGSPPKA